MGKVGKVEEMADLELFENETSHKSKPEAGTADQHRRTKLVKFTVIAAIVIIALLIVIIVPTLWANGGGKEQKHIVTSANTDTNHSKINTEAGFDRFVTAISTHGVPKDTTTGFDQFETAVSTHDVPKDTSTGFDQFETAVSTHDVPKDTSTGFDQFVTVVPTPSVRKYPGPTKDIREGPSYIIMSNLDGTVLQGEGAKIKLGPYTHENRQHFKLWMLDKSISSTIYKYETKSTFYIQDRNGHNIILQDHTGNDSNAIIKLVSVIYHTNKRKRMVSNTTTEHAGIVNIQSEPSNLCLANGGNNSIPTESNLVFRNCSMALEMQWRLIPVC